MVFCCRMATERDLEKTDFNMLNNILFDCTGHFILYPTLMGVKIINITTNRCINILGSTDNIRPLRIGLFQVIFAIIDLAKEEAIYLISYLLNCRVDPGNPIRQL